MSDDTTIETPAAGLTGRRLGHFILGQRLGGGVVSAVYRAVDERTGTPIALKTLLPGADEVMRERFRREAELVRNLHHDHIVETLEIGEAPAALSPNGETQAVAYIAMELADGYSLAQLLERHGRISASDAAAILAPIAQALAYAHAQDIVHRDVKPSNILLRREEGNPPGSVRISAMEHAVTPLLTDFGIARAMDAPELTNAGRTIGTPAFMSPEQCAGEEELDGRSDIYGLGAVLYRCVVGKTPYSGSTTQMLYAHVYEPLLIPDEMVALLPPIALNALQRAMMKDRNQRYNSAAEMAADLKIASGRIDQDVETVPGAHTVTMPALPTVRREGQSTTSRVLVPVSLPPAPTRPPIPPERNRTTVKLETAIPRVTEPRRTPPAPRRRFLRRRAWGPTIATLVVALGLILAGGWAFASMFWSSGFDFLPGLVSTSATPTPVLGIADIPDNNGVNNDNAPSDNQSGDNNSGVAAVPTRDSATPALADGTPDTGDDSQPDDADESGPSVDGDIIDDEPGDEADAAAETTPEPPDIPIETAWESAQEAYAAEEWTDALDWLLIVRRVDPEFETTQVRTMLQTTYLALAQTDFEEGDTETALQWLVDAALQVPDTELAARLESAYAAYRADQGDAEQAPGDDNDSSGEADGSASTPDAATTEELRAALADIADAILAETAEGGVQPVATPTGAFLASSVDACTAALYGSVAVALGAVAPGPSGDAPIESPWLEELLLACNAEEGTPPPATPTGRLIYSTQEGSDYRIYAMSFANPGFAGLMVDGAAQPRLGVNGRIIAFYSWQRGVEGLHGLDLSMGQSPAARTVQFTNAPEDSRDGPPSWSPGGDALAFSSTRFNDGRHRIYITSADSNHDSRELRLGRDPAWHPWLDWIVFNGVDDSGQNPGLWMIRADGTDLRQLTDNGNDLRPVWTPDGSAIVFMSSGRHGNWELYRLDLQTGAIARLTFSEAQDGLPAVSPDGRYVAFASDRAGFWEFWYVPLLGGDSMRLGGMNGQLVNWLEHGLQWVP